MAGRLSWVGADLTVAVTRTAQGSADPRRLAAETADAPGVHRLLALAPVPDRRKCQDAARLARVNRPTLRDWLHRYNVFSMAGPARGLSRGMAACRAEGGGCGPDIDRAGPGCGQGRGLTSRPRVPRYPALHQHCAYRPLDQSGFVRTSARPRHPGAGGADLRMGREGRRSSVSGSYGTSVDRCCTARNGRMDRPNRIPSPATRSGAEPACASDRYRYVVRGPST